MRLAATSSALSASAGHCASAASISVCVRAQRLRRQRSTLVELLVSSISAASPRARTSAMMPRTAARHPLPSRAWRSDSASNCAAKSGARASSRRAMSAYLRGRDGRARPMRRSTSVRPASMHFDLEPDASAAGEDQFDRAAGIVRALRRERDRQQRDHRIGRAALELVRLDRQHAVEMQAARARADRRSSRSSSHWKRLNSAAKRRFFGR